MTVMDETIDERGRHDVIAEDVAPRLEAFIRREHRGRVLVARRHQLKEQHGAGAGDRQVADLVDDQERGMREDLETRLQATGGLRLFQRGDQSANVP